MRKIDRMDIIRIVLILTLVAGAGLALGAVGRFTPTHKIVEPVFCVSCHPEQALELTATTHLQRFAAEVQDSFADGNDLRNMTDAEAISGACTMCHNFWDNFKWFGVIMDIESIEYDNPGPLYDHEPATGAAPSGVVPDYTGPVDVPTDIYGNEISNYGMGSTEAWLLTLTDSGFYDYSVVPWEQGLNEYAYTDTYGNNLKRVDYLWSALSALSPGPVAFRLNDTYDNSLKLCGTAEKGLCHVALEAVAISARHQKQEFSDNAVANGGAGVFFQHEMAYTTAQYSAKPVKLCGACHVFKLPPMVWGGEAWANMDIKTASMEGSTGEYAAIDFTSYVDPFVFTPAYDLTGEYHGKCESVPNSRYFDVMYKTPDWAHQNVPCIRCHSHAGITGETVSSNK